MRVARRAPMRSLATFIGAVGVITLPFLGGRAHAATAYRYWAYFVAQGHSWNFSQRGPAAEYPVDGEVQGWRFAVQADAGQGLAPRGTTAVATLCASTPAVAGQLRVGVVLDFGTSADAPTGERPPAAVVSGCVQVPEGSTGADVLRAAGAVRIGTGADGGLVCGIDGYPKSECAAVVSAPAPLPTTARPSLTTPRPSPTIGTPRTSAAGLQPSAPAATAVPTTDPTPPATTSAASTPATSAGAVSLAAGPSAPSLASLRTAGNATHHFPVAAVTGASVIVLLGAGAAWRARVARR